MDETVALVGAGLIGQGWSIVFARAGHEVNLYDVSPEGLDAASRFVRDAVEDLSRAGLLAMADVGSTLSRIHFVGDLATALEGASYVQESTFEELTVKTAIVQEIERHVGERTILASSTSSLLPSAISIGLSRPEMFVVAHPVNPPHLIPYVEIVPAPATASDATARTYQLLQSVGQVPVVLQREVPGFLLNRLQVALINEAISLVSEGYATVQEVDLAISHGLGYRWSFMGPFETIDLNAPGGITDYLNRFAGMYGLAHGMKPQTPFSNELLTKLEKQRRKILPSSEMGDRRRWRDQRLMKLIKDQQ